MNTAASLDRYGRSQGVPLPLEVNLEPAGSSGWDRCGSCSTVWPCRSRSSARTYARPHARGAPAGARTLLQCSVLVSWKGTPAGGRPLSCQRHVRVRRTYSLPPGSIDSLQRAGGRWLSARDLESRLLGRRRTQARLLRRRTYVPAPAADRAGPMEWRRRPSAGSAPRGPTTVGHDLPSIGPSLVS